MSEHRERLRSLDRLPTPDVWDRVADLERSLPTDMGPLPKPQRRGQRLVAAAVAFAIFVGAGSFAWFAFRPDGTAPAGSSTPTPGVHGSPTGAVVFADRPGDLYTFTLGSIPERLDLELPNSRVRSAAWSPDGTTIAFGTEALNPDGTSVVGGLYTVNVDGSDLRHLADFPGLAGRSVAWSADGTQIAYSASTDSSLGVRTGLFNDVHAYVVSASGGEPLELGSTGGVVSVTWSRDDGQVLVVRARLAAGGHTGGQGYITTASQYDLSTGEETPLLQEAADNLLVWTPVWSQDGSTVVFSGMYDFGDPSANADLFVATPDGTSVTPITGLPGSEDAPVFSPDGSFIAFTYSDFRDYPPERGHEVCAVMVVPADGSAAPTIVLEGEPSPDPSVDRTGCPVSLSWRAEPTSTVPGPSAVDDSPPAQ